MIEVPYNRFDEVTAWCEKNIAPCSVRTQGYYEGLGLSWRALSLGRHPKTFLLFIVDSKKELMALIKFGSKYT